MKYSKCSKCNARFLVPRDFCPECNSKEITELSLKSGTVLHCVKLIATPEPYPEQYFLVLAEDAGLKFFCRSNEEVKEGTAINVEETEDGIICHIA